MIRNNHNINKCLIFIQIYKVKRFKGYFLITVILVDFIKVGKLLNLLKFLKLLTDFKYPYHTGEV